LASLYIGDLINKKEETTNLVIEKTEITNPILRRMTIDEPSWTQASTA